MNNISHNNQHLSNPSNPANSTSHKLEYVYNYADTYVVETKHINMSILSSMTLISRNISYSGIFIDMRSQICPFIDQNKDEINTVTDQHPYRVITSITIKKILKK